MLESCVVYAIANEGTFAFRYPETSFVEMLNGFSWMTPMEKPGWFHHFHPLKPDCLGSKLTNVFQMGSKQVI